MISTELAPICLFVYNRLDETKQTIEALKQNFLASESELYIFSDGAKNEGAIEKVQNVRTYIKSVTGFKTIQVFESQENKGLANSIIQGVSKIIKEHGKVIVLEDDLLTTTNFLNFMNQALEFYKYEENLQSINGYSLFLKSSNKSVYFQTRPFSWGWATWEEKWNEELFNKNSLKILVKDNPNILKKFNEFCGDDISKMFLDSLHNINDSWYVRWAFNHFYTGRISVYPTYSLVENIGFNIQGTNCKGINSYKSIKDTKGYNKFDLINDLREDPILKKEFLRYFSKFYKLKFRIKLLFLKNGRLQLKDEFDRKILKND